MDLKQIEKLMESMQKAKIKRLAIKREGFEIELEREIEEGAAKPQVNYAPPPSFSKETPSYESASTSKPMSAKEIAPSKYVTSPMVGTFYAAPSPDDPSFVKVGDLVTEKSVMCIIEAMKVMNEVKSGMKGKVAEILVKSGDPVEFGTKMFRIEI